MEVDPFPDLNIKSPDFLDSVDGRSLCPKCQKSRKYYCYTCYVPVTEVEKEVPRLRLPIKVDVIKHRSEVDGKSTAVHAGVIAPDDVTIYTYPCIPDYENRDKVVLVFPGEDSITLEEMVKQFPCQSKNSKDNEHKMTSNSKRKLEEHASLEQSSQERDQTVSQEGTDAHYKRLKLNETQSTENSKTGCETQFQLSADNGTDTQSASIELEKRIATSPHAIPGGGEISNVAKQKGDNSGPLERVIFIDSTWNQTRSICKDERLKGLRCVELKTRTTKFWRHQKDIPDTFLSTIEAIYYFLREYHDAFIPSEYTGEYDNLLFFFVYMYKKIRSLYDGGKSLKAYKGRKDNGCVETT